MDARLRAAAPGSIGGGYVERAERVCQLLRRHWGPEECPASSQPLSRREPAFLASTQTWLSTTQQACAIWLNSVRSGDEVRAANRAGSPGYCWRRPRNSALPCTDTKPTTLATEGAIREIFPRLLLNLRPSPCLHTPLNRNQTKFPSCPRSRLSRADRA